VTTWSVVDTNVLAVANGEHASASLTCQLAAVNALQSTQLERALVLDLGGEILGEYRKHGAYSGQPGVGDEFFRWAVENQGTLIRVELTEDPVRRFDQFPADPDLANFDWDDRVFVATAAAAPGVCEIVNALDSDYSHATDALERNGVLVCELCPDELKAQ
jgi:hypothetical protein